MVSFTAMTFPSGKGIIVLKVPPSINTAFPLPAYSLVKVAYIGGAIKSENLPGCADLTGSVAGIIKRKVNNIFIRRRDKVVIKVLHL
jgi:hypothetical protein